MKIFKLKNIKTNKFWNSYKTNNFSREGHSFKSFKNLIKSLEKLKIKPNLYEYVKENCVVVEFEVIENQTIIL